jgi:hypothetical protein
MVYLGEGVESVMGTISFCCITRFLIEDHNALANAIYTNTRFKCKSAFPMRPSDSRFMLCKRIRKKTLPLRRKYWNEEA